MTAVLFDLGDVLVHLRLARGLERFRRLAGREHPLLADPAAFYVGPRTWDFSAGATGPDVFFDRLARELSLSTPRAELEAAWCDIFDPWPEMEALAAQVLDRGHPAYLMSNTDPVHFGLLRSRLPVLARFAGLHLSYEAGVNKPDPRFFTSALARFGLEAQACAYLDDRPDNVAAAAGVGIPGLVFTADVAAARAFLRSRGVHV